MWRRRSIAPNFSDDLPFILCSGPPYKVYTALYAEELGEMATADEAAILVVANLPGDLQMGSCAGV